MEPLFPNVVCLVISFINEITKITPILNNSLVFYYGLSPYFSQKFQHCKFFGTYFFQIWKINFFFRFCDISKTNDQSITSRFVVVKKTSNVDLPKVEAIFRSRAIIIEPYSEYCDENCFWH